MKPLAVGDRIRRIKDGRRFKITFIKHLGPTPVFSAVSDDDEVPGWGGPLSKLLYGETFVGADDPAVPETTGENSHV